MTELEQPPQNGIDPTAGEDDDNNKARPADIEQDMREMERRKRVEAIMGSKLFREELERIVDSAREGGAGASGILQQLSDIVGVPVNRVSNVFKSSSCMVPINDIRGVESMGYAKGEKILRCKLAAAFRLLDLNGWTQGLGAQITARLKVDQEYFLVNPYGLLYHEITASSLNKVDMQGQIVEQGTTNFGVNKSHFVLHSVVHAARPDIRCAIYIGCSPVVAISSLKSGLLALTKDACVLGEISTHAYTGLFDEEERNRLVRSLGPNSKVMLLSNHGALCCGETIEEAYYAASHIVQACETQLKLLPVGLDNLVLIPEESRKLIYDQSRRPPEDLEKKFAAVTTAEEDAPKEEAVPRIGSPPKWRVGGADFEALMRMLDNAGYRTGYIYRHPLIKSDPPKPKNDVELPPAVSSLGYLLEEEELFRQGIWKKGDIRKGGDRSRWLNSPNVYQKVEVLETGTPDPKKITKWVAEGSPTHSTPVRIEDPLQFVPAGTTTKEFKRVQQQIKDNRRADKISAGPQSHILEGVTWDEANRIKDATVSQTGDHVVLMGAASKGIIQRGFQHNATVYKAPYAKNPFDNVTDDELNEYKRTVERKKKSIHGEYTDTDFSESEALNSMQAAGAHAHAKHAQSEPETEHQVIQIQTQQAPIPSQAEVVLSDATLSFINGERSHTATNRKPPTGREDQAGQQEDQSIVYEELDKKKPKKPNEVSTSQCLPELNSKLVNPVVKADLTQLSSRINNQNEIYSSPSVNQNDIYSYAYASLGRCCQPQICSLLLNALQTDNFQSQSQHNQQSSPSTVTSSNESSTPRQRLHLTQVIPLALPAPYRTCSHFGFNSPRQTPRSEHRHIAAGLGSGSGSDGVRYRPMQRVLSFEEIFATPRYEHLCQFCFDHLLRLKPELQRRQSSAEDPDELVSYPSSSVTPRKLTTLTEDEESVYCNASTQTGYRFLRQLERFNYSEESTNVNYLPGSQLSEQTFSSPAASATSEAPLKSLPGNPQQTKSTITDITEVWNFGNWQQQSQQDQEEQQPLTERHITLEITQQFNPEQTERQLMSRDERQRRKSEFEELWQDHVDYFGAKEALERKLTTEVGETVNQKEQNEVELVAEQLPQMLQDFEHSLSAAGENLEKLMVTAKKLQAEETNLNESPANGSLFRAISLENIPAADDGVAVSEPAHVVVSSDDEEEQEQEEELELEAVHEEKRDVEKPVTPLPAEENDGKQKEKLECAESDEKDVDENEGEKVAKEAENEREKVVKVVEEQAVEVATPSRNVSESQDKTIFSPLEREILQRIEADKLKERESIFGRIDESIRNKLTPCRLRNIVTDVEETFQTCTRIFRTPTPAAPHLFQFSSEPRPSAYTMHNIDAPNSCSAHVHLITGQAPRLTRSWTSYQESSEDAPSPTQSTSSLESSVSSKTFVCRSTPRQKRNFIQENIRNASRPRPRVFPLAKSTVSTAANRKNRNQESSYNDASSVCTFQAEERGSSARLWVTLPLSPRSVVGQKRRSVSPSRAAFSTSHSSCSSYGKRRKPLGTQLSNLRKIPHAVSSLVRKSISSRTFFSETCEVNDSTGLMQVESNSTFELEVEEETVAEKLNQTNSTVYFSANDSTLTDSQRKSRELQENADESNNNDSSQVRLSGGETTESISQTEQASMEEDEILEPTPSTSGERDSDGNGNDHDIEAISLAAEEANDQEEEPSLELKNEEEETSLELKIEEANNEEEESSLESKIEEDKPTEEDDNVQTSSAENLTIALANESDVGFIILQESTSNKESAESEAEINPNSAVEEEEDEQIIVEVESSCGFSLSSVPATFNLAANRKSLSNSNSLDYEESDSESSSVEREHLLTGAVNLQSVTEEEDDDEDDDKPITSAAAAKKRKSKKKGAEDNEEEEVVVLKTQCKIKDGTLHVSEEPLEDIQAPRYESLSREKINPCNPFTEYEDWNIFGLAGNEEIPDELEELQEEEEEEEAEEEQEENEEVEEDDEEEDNEEDNEDDEEDEESETDIDLEWEENGIRRRFVRYDNVEQMSFEVDTGFLSNSHQQLPTISNTNNNPSLVPSVSYLVVPPGTYNFGAFSVRFRVMGEDQPNDNNANDNSSLQTLEVTQNEANQSMVLQQTAEIDNSDNTDSDKAAADETETNEANQSIELQAATEIDNTQLDKATESVIDNTEIDKATSAEPKE